MKLKYVEDYYDKVHEYFPDLTKEDYMKIACRGLRLMYTVCLYGGDLFMQSYKWGYSILIGKLFTDQKLYWKYQNIKWRIKCRIRFFWKHTVWDGKYYFGLTEEEYKKYIPKKSGRYKNKIEIEDVYVSKIREEFSFYYTKKYIFSITGLEDFGIAKYMSISSRNIILVGKRDSNNIIQPVNG